MITSSFHGPPEHLLEFHLNLSAMFFSVSPPTARSAVILGGGQGPRGSSQPAGALVSLVGGKYTPLPPRFTLKLPSISFLMCQPYSKSVRMFASPSNAISETPGGKLSQSPCAHLPSISTWAASFLPCSLSVQRTPFNQASADRFSYSSFI